MYTVMVMLMVMVMVAMVVMVVMMVMVMVAMVVMVVMMVTVMVAMVVMVVMMMILAAIKPVTDLTFPTAFRLHGRREVHERRGFCVPVGSPGPGPAGAEEPEVGLHHLHLLPLVLPPHAWAPACPPRLPVEAAR